MTLYFPTFYNQVMIFFFVWLYYTVWSKLPNYFNKETQVKTPHERLLFLQLVKLLIYK